MEKPEPAKSKPRFEHGRFLMTPGAAEVMRRCDTKPSVLLDRHLCGDWGVVDADDAKANERALNPKDPLRILSAYKLTPDDTLWIITERDRSVTTILKPDEY